MLTEGVMVRICRLLEAAANQAIETEHEHINLQTLRDDDLTTETRTFHETEGRCARKAKK